MPLVPQRQRMPDSRSMNVCPANHFARDYSFFLLHQQRGELLHALHNKIRARLLQLTRQGVAVSHPDAVELVRLCAKGNRELLELQKEALGGI